jgi:signal transduction histidine kinase
MVPTPTTRLRRLALAVTPLVVVATVIYADASGVPADEIARILLVAGSFLVTGFVAWSRRPANRMGGLMVALALSLLGVAFAQPTWPALVLVGLISFTASSALLGYLILAYPSGELRTTANRVLIALTVVLVGGPRLMRLLTRDAAAAGQGYDNPYFLISAPDLAGLLATLPYVLDAVVLVAFIGFVAARWIRASPAARRTLAPVLLPTLALLGILLADAVALVAGGPADVIAALEVAQLLGRTLIPFGFLLGLLRTQMARTAIADLVVELGGTPTPGRLRDVLAHALGDPGLSIAYRGNDPDTFIDGDGSPIDLPAASAARAVTMLERDGTALVAIIHDPALLEDPGLVAAVTSALRLATDNERLQVQVESQLDEVRASRARIVEAGDAERKRVERDLHDGAQQRLVSLTLALRVAQTKLGDTADPAVRLSLEQASSEARAALAELRELARGIHPQVLTEAGLAAAVESLADRSPIDVSVDVAAGRFSSAVEGAAYFVVSEALANVAKYANARHADVRTSWRPDWLTIEIADDGIGGADPASGSGLRGLADRLAAIDGTLEITSPTGGGTRLLARIPATAPAALPG